MAGSSSSGSARRGHADLALGPLPVAIVNRTLRLELEPGEVVITVSNQVHARRRHPEDYDRCLPHLAAVIANPLYLGDDFKNGEGFELIGRPPGLAEAILVAIRFEPDAAGNYRVASFYPVNERKIQGRRERGFLRLALP